MTTANAKALGREKQARKASSKSAQRKSCDVAFSLWVRSIGVCEAAGEGNGCKGNLQCAHILTRGYSTIRWLPANALSLCAGHHIFFTHRPIAWTDFVIAKLGQSVGDERQRMSGRQATVLIEACPRFGHDRGAQRNAAFRFRL